MNTDDCFDMSDHVLKNAREPAPSVMTEASEGKDSGEIFTTLAHINFIILIPFSFLYYYYSSEKAFPVLPFFPQRTIPLTVSMILLSATVIKWPRNGGAWVFWSGLSCLTWVAAVTFFGVWKFAGHYDAAGEGVGFFQSKVVCLYLIFFATGYLLPENLKRRGLATLLFIFILGCVAINFDWSTLSIRLSTGNKTYLFLGDAFAIWALWTLAAVNPKTRWLVALAGLLGVAALISRAALISYAAAISLVLLYDAKLKRTLILTAGSLVAMIIVFASGKTADWRILRGYQSKSFNDSTCWTVFWNEPGEIHEFERDGEKCVRFAGGKTTGYRFWLNRPHSRIPRLRCELMPEENFQLIISCDSEKGNRRLIYSGGKAGEIIKRNVSPGRVFIYRRLPWEKSQWNIMERDLAADLMEAEPDNRLTKTMAVMVHGKGALSGMKLYTQAPEKDSWAHEDLDFFHRNFRQYEDRHALMAKQLSNLGTHWLTGDFAGQLRYGGMRYYIHNYLSFWQQYGLIPFLTLAAIFIWQYCLLTSDYCRGTRRNITIELAKWRKGMSSTRRKHYDRIKSNNPWLLLTFPLATFNLIEIVFARSYATPYIWLSLGLMAAYAVRRGKRNRRRKNGFSQPEST